MKMNLNLYLISMQNLKYIFDQLSLDIPADFDENNFKKINKIFSKIKGEPYSINSIDDILD